MPFQESFDILSFRSRQHAFYFCNILRDHGISSQVMSTPKEVALGCGLSLRFSPYVTRRVLDIYRLYNIPVIGCYHIDRCGSGTRITRIPI
ncbi:MAG: DUF3343 domain-containing protein [Caldicoprobacterales bacterium]|jgi:hypothetical protein|nr:DUF3343 domain-containing protein [Clostridiales bacterium]